MNKNPGSPPADPKRIIKSFLKRQDNADHNAVRSAVHIADISGASSYEVNLEFLEAMEAMDLSRIKMPYVSLLAEMIVNTVTPESNQIRAKFGRFPYSSPLYIWETQIGGKRSIAYVGQTVRMAIFDRFRAHHVGKKLLAEKKAGKIDQVLYRLCSRFDLYYCDANTSRRVAIEHLPAQQARKIVDDIEGWLIYKLQPPRNTMLKKHKKRYWKPFTVTNNIGV